MEVAIGLAFAEAGPTAAPTATVLMTSAAAMAMRVRVNCDCDDIFNLPLSTRRLGWRPMPATNQGACQSRKTAKNITEKCNVADFPNQELAPNPNSRSGTFANAGASSAGRSWHMLGKLAGAWIGSKVAGENEGGKGAILGAGAVAVGKRLAPTIAALALGGWAFKKWREHKRSHPSYPSEASPRVPASETSSPS
jgi:hypothetical protein